MAKTEQKVIGVDVHAYKALKALGKDKSFNAIVRELLGMPPPRPAVRPLDTYKRRRRTA